MTTQDECTTLWSEEKEAMSATLGKDFVCNTGPEIAITVVLILGVDLPSGSVIKIQPDGTPLSARGCELHISHLPPISLTVRVPSCYPLVDSAKLVSIQPQEDWIAPSSIQVLSAAVERLLEEARRDRQTVFWRLFEFFRYGELLVELGMIVDPSLAQDCIVIRSDDPTMLAARLLAHNARVLNDSFEEQSFPCPICLEVVKGSKCLRLQMCGHVTCRPCLARFWGASIQEGDVDRVGCVNEVCVKKVAKDAKFSSVDEAELRTIVGDELLNRWLALKEKRAIESDPTIVRCPIQGCQAPVPAPPPNAESDADEGWNRLRTCPSCDFSFCVLCKRTWHGPIAGCRSSATADLLEEYLAEPQGSPVRSRLERQFGKKNLAKMIDTYLEGKANEEWLSKRTQKCPGCDTSVEKSEGCNHMKCGRCQMHFCYRCGARLRADNPYLHFSMRGSPCYGNLFDLRSDPADLDWQPLAAFELE